MVKRDLRDAGIGGGRDFGFEKLNQLLAAICLAGAREPRYNDQLCMSISVWISQMPPEYLPASCTGNRWHGNESQSARDG